MEVPRHKRTHTLLVDNVLICTHTQAQLEAAKEAQRMETAKLLIDTFSAHVDLAGMVQVGRKEWVAVCLNVCFP